VPPELKHVRLLLLLPVVRPIDLLPVMPAAGDYTLALAGVNLGLMDKPLLTKKAIFGLGA
jgi:hypothetical protein